VQLSVVKVAPVVAKVTVPTVWVINKNKNAFFLFFIVICEICDGLLAVLIDKICRQRFGGDPEGFGIVVSVINHPRVLTRVDKPHGGGSGKQKVV